MEIFCNIIIIFIFIVTFDQFNASFLNKTINFLKNKNFLIKYISYLGFIFTELFSLHYGTAFSTKAS